jgi:hypothetical protein
MLDFSDHEQALVSAVGPLKCDVSLPSSFEDDACRSGQLPGAYSEKRRHPRFNFGGCAALKYRQTFPALSRPLDWHKVFTKDLSRGGLSFLHSEPLFPRERVQIVLPLQEAKTIEVVSCVRVQERCFRVGGRFVEQSQGADAADGESAAYGR